MIIFMINMIRTIHVIYSSPCVGEQAEQTHAHVSQNIMPVPVGQQIRALSMILEQQMNSNPNYKIMVFFPTARQTGKNIYVSMDSFLILYIVLFFMTFIYVSFILILLN